MESVQFMQFDGEGNLYVYLPGAGCSGIPRKISQGFSQDDLDNDTSHGFQDSTDMVGKDLSGFSKLKSSNVHKIIPQAGVSTDRLTKRFAFLV